MFFPYTVSVFPSKNISTSAYPPVRVAAWKSHNLSVNRLGAASSHAF
jgi:hypothetical protein